MWCDPPDSRSAGLPPAGPLSGGQLAPIVGGHHHNPLEHHADLKFSISPKISILGLNSGWHPFPVLALFAFSGAEMINLDLCSWLLLSCRFGWSWPLTGTAVRKEVEQKCLQWPGKHLATPCNTLQHFESPAHCKQWRWRVMFKFVVMKLNAGTALHCKAELGRGGRE